MQSITELYDVQQLPTLKAFRAYLASSYDREGGNYDWGNYERVTGQDGVVMDVDGPGIITRIWSADSVGQIRIYLDGHSTPVIDEPLGDFLQRMPLHWGVGCPQPGTPEIQTANANLSPLGHTTYYPIVFNAGCKVVLSPVPDIYYQVNYMLCNQPHGLASYTSATLPRDAAALDHAIARLVSPVSSGTSLSRHAGIVSLRPGQMHRILDQPGAMTIRSIRLRVDWPQDPHAARHLKEGLLIRAYWDDDNLAQGQTQRRKPSIKSPVAAFFMDFGSFDSYQTAIISRNGNEYECRFPMPIGQHAVIELINASCLDIDGLAFDIEYAPLASWSDDLCHFRAMYHSENATFGHDLANYRDEVMYLKNPDGQLNYPILRTHGTGHFVGCCFHADLTETPYPRAGGEADEAVFIDDDPRLTMWGTGNEDYVNDAWGFHPVITPLSGGMPSPDRTGFFGYRFHLADCIPFHRKIAFTLEYGSSNNCTGLYRSVAYYYMKPQPRGAFVNGVPPRRMNRYFSR